MSEAENIRQCQVLSRHKNQGPERQSPQFPSVEKKTDPVPQMFPCIPCGYEFTTEISLVKHRANLHARTPDSISRAVDEAKSFADVLKDKAPERPEEASKIPVVTSSVSTARSVAQQPRVANKRSYDCHECNFVGLSSKNLAKHVRETGHKKHDDLKENCYSCGETFLNFE